MPHRFVHRSTPILVKGGAAHWPAIKAWTFEELAQVAEKQGTIVEPQSGSSRLACSLNSCDSSSVPFRIFQCLRIPLMLTRWVIDARVLCACSLLLFFAGLVEQGVTKPRKPTSLAAYFRELGGEEGTGVSLLSSCGPVLSVYLRNRDGTYSFRFICAVLPIFPRLYRLSAYLSVDSNRGHCIICAAWPWRRVSPCWLFHRP